MKQLAIVCLLALFLCLNNGCDNHTPTAKNNPSSVHKTTTATTDYGSSDLTVLISAELARGRKDYATAGQHYFSLAQRLRQPQFAKQATKYAIHAGQLERALDAAVLWSDLEPRNLQAKSIVVILIIKTQRAWQAAPYLKNMFKQHRAKASAAIIYMSKRLQTKAAKTRLLHSLQQLASQDPKDLLLKLNIALLALDLQKNKIAAETVQQVLAVKPNWNAAIAIQAQVYVQQQQPQRALAYLQQQLQRDPNNPRFRQTYAAFLVKMDAFKQATVQYKKLVNVPGFQGHALLNLAEIALAQQAYSQAENYLRQGLASGYKLDQHLFLLGQIAVRQGQLQKAQDWYAKIKAGPYLLRAQLKIALILAEQGEFTQALNRLSRIRVSTAQQLKLLALTRAKILVDANRFNKALSVVNKALKVAPNDLDLRYTHGIIAAKLGQYNVMERDFKAILAVQANNAQVLNAYGFILADKTTRYQEAKHYLQRAFKLSPHDPAILDSMGWLQYKLGHYAAAITYLTKALALSQDPEIAAHLGEVLWVAGQRDKAQAIWKTALQRNPHNAILLETIKRLKP